MFAYGQDINVWTEILNNFKVNFVKVNKKKLYCVIAVLPWLQSDATGLIFVWASLKKTKQQKTHPIK